MKTMSLTQEQERIVSLVRDGHNVCVTAVAGSGKSTTILNAIRALKHPCLVLTYNTILQTELEPKIPSPHTVLTFHAAAGRFFKKTLPDDSAMERAIAEVEEELFIEEMAPQRERTIFIDEARREGDLCLLPQRLAPRAVDDGYLPASGRASRSEQLINDFSRDPAALEDFMPRPSSFLCVSRPFVTAHLTISFRLPPTIAGFANATGGGGCIRAGGRGQGTVAVVHCPNGQQWMSLVHSIEEAACLGTVFLLVARKKNNMALRALVNVLRRRGNSLGVDKVDSKEVVLRAKIKVSSFHSSKGLEAETVFVLGAKRTSRKSEARPLHVAVTRAKQRLVFVESHDERPDVARFGLECMLRDGSEGVSFPALHRVEGFDREQLLIEGLEGPFSMEPERVAAAVAAARERFHVTAEGEEHYRRDLGTWTAEEVMEARLAREEAIRLDPPVRRDVTNFVLSGSEARLSCFMGGGISYARCAHHPAARTTRAWSTSVLTCVQFNPRRAAARRGRTNGRAGSPSSSPIRRRIAEGRGATECTTNPTRDARGISCRRAELVATLPQPTGATSLSYC